MDPHIYQSLLPLSKMIDELRKIFAQVNAKLESKASVVPAEPETIEGLKARKAVLMKEVEMMHHDWLKAMESFYAVQGCLLDLCHMARPKNAQVVFVLPVLLMQMREELGQRIAEEKMAQLTVVSEVTDGIADVDALISENTALKAQLKALGDGWLRMNAAFVAYVKHLVAIGLILAPTQ